MPKTQLIWWIETNLNKSKRKRSLLAKTTDVCSSSFINQGIFLRSLIDENLSNSTYILNSNLHPLAHKKSDNHLWPMPNHGTSPLCRARTSDPLASNIQYYPSRARILCSTCMCTCGCPRCDGWVIIVASRNIPCTTRDAWKTHQNTPW